MKIRCLPPSSSGAMEVHLDVFSLNYWSNFKLFLIILITTEKKKNRGFQWYNFCWNIVDIRRELSHVAIIASPTSLQSASKYRILIAYKISTSHQNLLKIYGSIGKGFLFELSKFHVQVWKIKENRAKNVLKIGDNYFSTSTGRADNSERFSLFFVNNSAILQSITVKLGTDNASPFIQMPM